MPTQYTPEEYPLWSYDKMMSSPAFEDHETVIGPRTDDWTQYSWTLDASYSGQRIYALPDAGIFSYSPSVTFPEDTKFLENHATVTVVQPYVWYAHDGSVFQKGFAYVFDGHSGDPGNEVYDQYGLPYNYVDVGALYEDWHSALPGSNEWVDYADHYVLLAGSLSAGFDQYLAGQDARILVTTFGPNSRDGAWGPNWLNHYYYDGSPPQSETDPFATHIDSFSTIYGSILAALEGIPKVAQAREIAGQYLDLDAQIRMDGATLGNPTFAPFAGRDAAFDEFRATSIGASDDNPTVKKALGFAGKLLTAADVGATIVNNYQQTGGNYSKTIQAGGVKLLAALVSGELGTLAGTGAAAFLVSAVGAPIAATGLATIAGIAVGVGVGYVVDKGVTIGANWLIDQAFPDHGALARAAGDKPAWSYNVDTGKFKWLDSKVEAKYGQYLTLLDVNPKPVGLKLKGDLYADKDDFLLGHGGKDTMSSGNGNDILYGAGNSDSISSGNGTDIIYGDKGNDTILGGAGADTIFGGAGNDRILGGKGSDALTGEAGKDRFVFQSVAEIGKGALGDTIYDFTRGKDKIDLSAIDADPRKAGNQAFKWSKLTKTFVEDDWKGHLLVEGDLNKDGQPDFTLKLVGISAVSASDFIL